MQLFASYFGPIHWTFLWSGVRFTGFFAAVAGSGLPQETRFWRLLEKLPDLPPARHHVAMMHYWPFMEQPDEPAWDLTKADRIRQLVLFHRSAAPGAALATPAAAGVELLFCGHVHTGRPVQTVDGIRIYRTPAAGNTPQLAERWPDAETRVRLSSLRRRIPNGIEVTFIPGDDQCEEFDSYGPWGHPRIDERDYSVARERPPLEPR